MLRVGPDRDEATSGAVCFSSQQRLEALVDYQILDTPEEQGFDDLATLAADIFEAPIAAITLLDSGRQWFKAKVGIDVRETPLESSVCVHGLLGADLLVVPDATKDSRFRHNPAVCTDDGVRFYAGARLANPDGIPLGMICVADTKPREGITKTQERMLRTLAAQVVAQLELRKECRERARWTAIAEKAREEAELAASAKASFLANMSHELRTPLSGVLGFSELLLDSPLDSEQRGQAETVHQSAKALLALLNDILDFSKIEAGALDISPEPTRLRSLLKQCLSLVEPSAQAKGLAVFLHVHDDVPDHLVLDGMRVRQIALNLLGNAVKFTQRGFVSLEADLAGENRDRLIIRVHDTGIGIAPERKEAIFADFVQADASVARHYGGTGLGLSISRRLAGLLEGSLELDSELGRGTKVCLELPLSVVEQVIARDEVEAPQPAHMSAKILLVEDVKVNQLLATALLKKLGHDVELAVDGAEALSKIEARPRDFQLVFMDIQLPVMDGLEATRRIRALRSAGARVPVVGLSANAYAEDVSDCLKAGMNDHLAKPFTSAGLADKVNRWASRSAQKAAVALDPSLVGPLEHLFREQVVEVAGQVAKLQRALAHDGDQALEETILEVKQASHKIAGTAASFGKADLGTFASEVEHFLEGIARHRESLDSAKEVTDRFAALLRAAA